MGTVSILFLFFLPLRFPFNLSPLLLYLLRQRRRRENRAGSLEPRDNNVNNVNNDGTPQLGKPERGQRRF